MEFRLTMTAAAALLTSFVLAAPAVACPMHSSDKQANAERIILAADDGISESENSDGDTSGGPADDSTAGSADPIEQSEGADGATSGGSSTSSGAGEAGDTIEQNETADE